MNGRLEHSVLSAEDLRGRLLQLVGSVRREIGHLPHREAERVHEIRVSMKKFRALLRLVSGSLSVAAFKRADALARELKNHFASSRDNEVLRELLLDLLPRAEAGDAVKCLGFDLTAPAATSDAKAVTLCDQLAVAVAKFPLDRLTPAKILDALAATYRSGRRTMKWCAKGGDDFLFHEWRKCVKQLLYQSAALPPCRTVARLQRPADRLATLLGNHHDLALLLEKSAGRDDDVAAVVRKKKKSVARRALTAGRKVFAEKPAILRKSLS